MKLTEQLQEWNENDEYQKIIDAIEGLPDEERTPELISDGSERPVGGQRGAD